MIIDKKLSIITYAGSLPLNLMTKDPNIANNPTKSNQWDKFIQSVDTIYATQKTDDTVPVFWTRRFSTIDQFGNVSYKYAPHPQSTLKTLDSKSAYYIILRDSSLAPIKIPVHGSLVLGYSDAEDLPFVFPSLPDVVLNKDSFEYSFKPRIINLKPYETYTYSWKVVSSNWPVVANSISGTLKPASTTGTINSTLTFCPTTGECSDTVLDYDLPTACSLEQNKDPYITLQLSVTPNAAGTESLSDQFTVSCNDCLPRPRIDISGISSNIVIEPEDDSAATPSYNFNINFSNLDLNTQYSYTIETIKADWPIVHTTPVSGSFINTTSQTPPIEGRFYFCPSTGLCPPNNTTIPAYQIPVYPKFLTGESEDYGVSIRAALFSNSPCSLLPTIYSDIVTIKYKKL